MSIFLNLSVKFFRRFFEKIFFFLIIIIISGCDEINLRKNITDENEIYSDDFLNSEKKEKNDLKNSFGKNSETDSFEEIELINNQENTDQSDTKKTVINEMLKYINDEYVNELDERIFLENLMTQILSSLDQYSSYIPEDDYQEILDSCDGELCGIGAGFCSVQCGLKIVSIMENSPSFNANLKINDVILEINSFETKNISEATAIKKFKVPLGDIINLKIKRGEYIFNVSLKRSIIKIPSIKISVMNEVLFVKIPYINTNSYYQLRKFLNEKILPQKIKIIGIIFDLRNNPGGTLKEAIKISKLFIDSGKIIEIKTKKENILISNDSPQRSFNKLPMVVIINSGSASGSEIIASALKCNKRAIIIGEKSYGKGSVQSIFKIPGYGAIKLTTANFFSVLGEKIAGNGILPDVKINSESKDKSNIKNFFESFNEYINYSKKFHKKNDDQILKKNIINNEKEINEKDKKNKKEEYEKISKILRDSDYISWYAFELIKNICA